MRESFRFVVVDGTGKLFIAIVIAIVVRHCVSTSKYNRCFTDQMSISSKQANKQGNYWKKETGGTQMKTDE